MSFDEFLRFFRKNGFNVKVSAEEYYDELKDEVADCEVARTYRFALVTGRKISGSFVAI